MRIPYSRRVSILLAVAVVVASLARVTSAQTDGLDDLQRAFQHPPDESRIMMRWWWFGPAVTKAKLEREMRLMKEGGIGGFEVQPVYPLALDDSATGSRMKAVSSEVSWQRYFGPMLRCRRRSPRLDSFTERLPTLRFTSWPIRPTYARASKPHFG
ncbi:MAG: hypothetical protein ACR2L2_18195 [Acidobacteriota bacterium]